MKKVFAIFAIAAIMVACGNKADKKTEVNKDTLKMENVAPVPDTTKPMTDTATMAPDTTKPKM